MIFLSGLKNICYLYRFFVGMLSARRLDYQQDDWIIWLCIVYLVWGLSSYRTLNNRHNFTNCSATWHLFTGTDVVTRGSTVISWRKTIDSPVQKVLRLPRTQRTAFRSYGVISHNIICRQTMIDEKNSVDTSPAVSHIGVWYIRCISFVSFCGNFCPSLWLPNIQQSRGCLYRRVPTYLENQVPK